jgi:hypothetical protein
MQSLIESFSRSRSHSRVRLLSSTAETAPIPQLQRAPTEPSLAAMAVAYTLSAGISSATVTNTASFLRIVALALISAVSIASRLFAVVSFESIIHELSVGFFVSLLPNADLPQVTRGSTSACICCRVDP